jgi:hypothetical protein
MDPGPEWRTSGQMAGRRESKNSPLSSTSCRRAFAARSEIRHPSYCFFLGAALSARHRRRQPLANVIATVVRQPLLPAANWELSRQVRSWRRDFINDCSDPVTAPTI